VGVSPRWVLLRLSVFESIFIYSGRMTFIEDIEQEGGLKRAQIGRLLQGGIIYLGKLSVWGTPL
jgi:hypothetical protein